MSGTLELLVRFPPPDARKITLWAERREKLLQEIREYHELADKGLHAVCLQVCSLAAEAGPPPACVPSAQISP